MGYRRLHRVTEGYEDITRGYIGLHRVTEGYIGLQGVT